MTTKFNQSFNETGEKPTFMYKRNPLVPHSFQIFGLRVGREDYDMIGEYTLIDMDEDIEITEKKLMNLIAYINGKDKFIDFKDVTKQRVLYSAVPTEKDDVNQKVIFRTYDGDGVSKENAILVIEKGVFKDESVSRS